MDSTHGPGTVDQNDRTSGETRSNYPVLACDGDPPCTRVVFRCGPRPRRCSVSGRSHPRSRQRTPRPPCDGIDHRAQDFAVLGAADHTVRGPRGGARHFELGFLGRDSCFAHGDVVGWSTIPETRCSRASARGSATARRGRRRPCGGCPAARLCSGPLSAAGASAGLGPQGPGAAGRLRSSAFSRPPFSPAVSGGCGGRRHLRSASPPAVCNALAPASLWNFCQSPVTLSRARTASVGCGTDAEPVLDLLWNRSRPATAASLGWYRPISSIDRLSVALCAIGDDDAVPAGCGSCASRLNLILTATAGCIPVVECRSGIRGTSTASSVKSAFPVRGRYSTILPRCRIRAGSGVHLASRPQRRCEYRRLRQVFTPDALVAPPKQPWNCQ